jgi:arsenical pump membrane protein
MSAIIFIWALVALGVMGMIIRPWNWPEAIWPAAAALLLVALGLLPWRMAIRGIAEGGDVYLFLAGMMLLAELARSEKLFDWLAAHAAARARGSSHRLFGLIYLVGVVVTVFLSNDATAVVLTPAVAAAARAAAVVDPLPYLFICAFVANAASFVLPISNPANLVIYGTHVPPLLVWLPRYALASAACIIVTYLVLRWTQRGALLRPIAPGVRVPALSAGGVTTAGGIACMAVLLMLASGFGLPLGLPVFIAGIATMLAVWLPRRAVPWPVVKEMSWSVLVLVAGLFVLVQALAETGALARFSALLREAARFSPAAAVWGSGIVLAVASNLVNNLPVGLIAGHAATAAQLPPRIQNAVLLGVDIGPNLSGSLATILWLAALRREGIEIGSWRFLKLGLVMMPPALLLALLALFAG